MPIYECHCLQCDLTFEVLANVAAASQPRECPECGRLAPRIASTFGIVAGGAGLRDPKAPNQPTAHRQAPGPPLCLQNPHIPLLCHMDGLSAQRWIAHAKGHGAQYDDTLAARKELRRKRGLPSPPAPAEPQHSHDHNPRRHHTDAPSSGGAQPAPATPARGRHQGAHGHAHAHGPGGHTHTHGG